MNGRFTFAEDAAAPSDGNIKPVCNTNITVGCVCQDTKSTRLFFTSRYNNIR